MVRLTIPVREEDTHLWYSRSTRLFSLKVCVLKKMFQNKPKSIDNLLRKKKKKTLVVLEMMIFYSQIKKGIVSNKF